MVHGFIIQLMVMLRERDFGKREIGTYAVKTNKGSIVKKYFKNQSTTLQ